MQKKRVNLAEQYPGYFATAELTDNFAELTDVEIGRLDKIEAALTAKAEAAAAPAPAPAAEAPVVQAAAPAPATPAAPAEDPKYAALLARLEVLEGKPAASATAVRDDLTGEGKDKNPPKTYATSVDAELERFFK